MRAAEYSGREILLNLRRADAVGAGGNCSMSEMSIARFAGREVLLQLRAIDGSAAVQELPDARAFGVEVLRELRHARLRIARLGLNNDLPT